MSDRKRYMIRCDVDGSSGVVSYTQVDTAHPDYAFGSRMFKADLTACLQGLQEGGAGEIVIYDEHFDGRNVDPAWLPEGVSLIAGKPPYRADWAGGLDATFAGVLLVGFHSKAGTPDGLLHHSYEPDIRDLCLNGTSVGEIGIEAAVAGDFGLPILMVTGDSAGVAEAEALLPGVLGVAVKESLGESGGRCFPLSETTARIRAAAKIIVAAPPSVAPLRMGPEFTLTVTLKDGAYLDAVRRLHGNMMSDAQTLVVKGDSAAAVWGDYWQRKLAAQQAQQ